MKTQQAHAVETFGRSRPSHIRTGFPPLTPVIRLASHPIIVPPKYPIANPSQGKGL
jgi:hypothetical protein